jgi:hypothetical protein
MITDGHVFQNALVLPSLRNFKYVNKLNRCFRIFLLGLLV